MLDTHALYPRCRAAGYSNQIKDVNDTKKMKELIDSGNVYLKLNSEAVRSLINEQSQTTKNDLISQLSYIIEINRKINIEKSNGILWSFRVTILAILLLLIMTIFIGIFNIGTLR
jgi:hypothetical protein